MSIRPSFFCLITNYFYVGILPSVPKVQVSRPVCVQSTENDCFQTWNINIKFCCGNYLVYELRTSLVDKSAYCFGNNVFNVNINFELNKLNIINLFVIMI